MCFKNGGRPPFWIFAQVKYGNISVYRTSVLVSVPNFMRICGIATELQGWAIPKISSTISIEQKYRDTRYYRDTYHHRRRRGQGASPPKKGKMFFFRSKMSCPNVDRAPAPMLIVQLVRSLKYTFYTHYAMITDQSINQSVNHHSALVAGLVKHC